MNRVLSDFAKSLLILAGLMVIVILVLALTGQFKVDADHPTNFGVYNSALVNLPAYFNPFRLTLIVSELLALTLLPVVLVIFHKWLRLPVLPWLAAILLILVTLTALYSPISNALPGDELIDSNTRWCLYIELVIVASIFVCHDIYYITKGKKVVIQ